MQNHIILILRPLPYWSLTGTELRRVAALGRYMEAKAAVKAEWVAEGEAELRQLATLCQELQTDNIYTRYANKKLMRRMDDFWASDDATLRQHVKHRSDERLLKAVLLADSLDIPIFYQAAEGESLHIENRLTLHPEALARPVMCFRRHEEGISYTLKLRMTGREERLVTSKELAGHSMVLGHHPGLFIVDRQLTILADGFSGKLLLPFTTKAVVEIPRRIENDYMHRFILRNVAKAEIEAEGFDIHDTGDEPQPQLHTEKAIDGCPLLTLRFLYGGNTYTAESKANGQVTLTADDDGGFRFTRQMRDREKERHYMQLLTEMGGKPAPTGTLRDRKSVV